MAFKKFLWWMEASFHCIFKFHWGTLGEWVSCKTGEFICYKCEKCGKKWGDEKLIEQYGDGLFCPNCNGENFQFIGERVEGDKRIETLKCKGCGKYLEVEHNVEA